MAYLKRLASGAFQSLGSIIGVKLLSILSSAIIARLLGPANLGILSIFQNIYGVFESVSQSGSGSSIVKYTAEYKIKDKKELEKFLSTALISMFFISLSFAIAFFYLSDFISNKIYHEPAIAVLMKITAITLILSVFITIAMSILQGLQKIKHVAFVSIFNSAISIPISYLLIIKFGLVGWALASVISAVINLIFNLIFVRNNLKLEGLKLKFEIHRKYISKIFKYSIPLFIGAIIIRPARLYGQTLLAITQDFTQVGYFKVAFSLYNLMSFIPAAISVPLMPMITEIDASYREKRSYSYSKILKIIILIMLPFSIFVILFSKYILFGIYGERFIEASLITNILIVSAFFGIITSFLENLMLGTGKTVQVLYTNIYMALIFVISSYFLIRNYGTLGLGLAWLITDASLLPIFLYYATKRSYINMQGLKVPLLLSILLLMFTFLIQKLMAGIWLIIGAAIYISLIMLLEYLLMDSDEKKMIRRILHVIN